MMAKQVSISHPQFLALVYHDLFDYPLTFEELDYWQIGKEKNPNLKVEKSGALYFLFGRQEIIFKRVVTTQEADLKYKLALKTASVLRKIITVEYVGITGGLAMGNAQEDDDIDLVVITSKGCLWTTRLCCLFFLALSRIKVRRYGDKEVKNKICLNLWFDRESLSLKDRREIYTAHEILQVKTLFDRGGVYKDFLKINQWVSQFFPKAFSHCKRLAKRTPETQMNLISILFFKLGTFIEPVARLLQLKYMANKKSREIADKGRAMLHPGNWNEFVPQIFLSRLDQISRGKEFKEFTEHSSFKEVS